MDKERVKFYSRSDYFYSYMLSKALEKIRAYDNERDDYSLDDIIEFYNIVKYIDDAQSIVVNENDKKLLGDSTKKALLKTIGVFFSKINNSNISSLRIDSIHEFAEDYLDLFEKFKLYNRIGHEEFFTSLHKLKIHDSYIYQYKQLVHTYNKYLRERLLKDDESFELLLRKFLSTDLKKEIFLPSSLNKNDKEEITINYIKSEHAHINVLEIIISLPIFEDFSISDDTRVLAKDRYDELAKKLFDDKKDVGLKTDLIVKFSDEIKEEFKFENTLKRLSLTISKDWISKNLDYPTLLNNLIHILGLTDLQMRISNISKPNSMSAITRSFIDRKLKNFYLHDYGFTLMNNFSHIAVTAYRDYLYDNHNIRLEEIVQWFFEAYLPNEFSLNDFSVNMPSKDSTYLEKCRTICCEFESLLKQYDSLVKYGKVRHDVIEISSRPVTIETVRSFIDKKYVYPKMEKCSSAMFWLFSDQTLLTYFEGNKTRREYKNFYKLLLHEKININEYAEHQKARLTYLFNEKIIEVDEDGYLSFKNVKEVQILYDLYSNEFCSYTPYIKLGCKNELKKLIEKGWIYIDSSLFSIQECSYINFYLNKQKYFNGYDLRNTYLHGTQRKNGPDAELHKLNYSILLTLYLLAVIKINDDLCQRDDLLKKEH